MKASVDFRILCDGSGTQVGRRSQDMRRCGLNRMVAGPVSDGNHGIVMGLGLRRLDGFLAGRTQHALNVAEGEREGLQLVRVVGVMRIGDMVRQQ